MPEYIGMAIGVLILAALIVAVLVLGRAASAIATARLMAPYVYEVTAR
jgi:hypothetical protein